MNIAIAQATNSFPIGEPQAAAFVAVPASILEQILEEIQDLRAEVRDLKADNQDLKKKLAALEDRHVERLQAHSARLAGLELAQDDLEATLVKPTEHPKEPNQKTLGHLDEIATILTAKEKRLIEGQAPKDFLTRLRKEGMTFSQLANVIGLTVDRIRQLSRLAAADLRFNICWHPRRKNTKIFKLRRWDSQGF